MDQYLEKAFFRSQSKNALNYNSVGIGIYARSGASTVELSNDVKDKIRKIKPNLPAGLNLEIAFNRAIYISVAINEVYKTFVYCIYISSNNYLFIFRKFKSCYSSRNCTPSKSYSNHF